MSGIKLTERFTEMKKSILSPSIVTKAHTSLVTKESFSDADVGVSIYKTGNERASIGDWHEALMAWQNALSIFKDSLGDKHVYVARTLNKIGVAYYMLDEPYYAYEALERALALQQEILSPGDEMITRTLRNMNALLSEAREDTESTDAESDLENEGMQSRESCLPISIIELELNQKRKDLH